MEIRYCTLGRLSPGVSSILGGLAVVRNQVLHIVEGRLSPVPPGIWGVWMWLEIRYHTLLCQNRRNSMALHGKKTNVISIISQSQENKIFVSFQTQSLISEEHPVVCTLHSCSRGQGCSSVHTASSFLPFCFSQSLACSQDGGCSCHAPVAQLHPGVASGRFPARLQHSKHFWGSFFPLMKNYF